MDATTFDQIVNPKRREGIAFLTNDGKANHLRTFSEFGPTTADCAPVAWRFAYLLSRETGEPITSDLLASAMSDVVNRPWEVRNTVRMVGGYRYR